MKCWCWGRGEQQLPDRRLSIAEHLEPLVSHWHSEIECEGLLLSLSQDDICMHLTNYAINKHNENFIRDDMMGSKRYHPAYATTGPVHFLLGGQLMGQHAVRAHPMFSFKVT